MCRASFVQHGVFETDPKCDIYQWFLSFCCPVVIPSLIDFLLWALILYLQHLEEWDRGIWSPNMLFIYVYILYNPEQIPLSQPFPFVRCGRWWNTTLWAQEKSSDGDALDKHTNAKSSVRNTAALLVNPDSRAWSLSQAATTTVLNYHLLWPHLWEGHVSYIHCCEKWWLSYIQRVVFSNRKSAAG